MGDYCIDRDYKLFAEVHLRRDSIVEFQIFFADFDVVESIRD